MKRVRIQLINLLRDEIHSTKPSIFSTMRRNIIFVSFFAFILFASKHGGSTDAFSSSLPFLRGAPTPSTPIETGHHRHNLLGLGYLHRRINNIRHKMQSEAVKQWNSITDDIGRELNKFGSTIGRIFTSRQSHGTKKLDDVIKTFKSVLIGNEVDTAQLLKACRAHLILMRSGGTALRVVAKDMESNLNKAEALFNNIDKQDGKYLASLLEVERESGVHEGNELKDQSAAMGFLWIRRSLAFQLDLYSSLIPTNGNHPKEAAMQAYYKTLSPYHGWLLQKIFPTSLSQMPDRRVFLSKFGGTEVDQMSIEYEREIVRKLKSLVSTWEPIINTWTNEFVKLDLEDTRRA